MFRVMRISFICIVCLMVSGDFFISEAESEFSDTPYFSGMPNHMISDATDQEFAGYRFYNGKNCITVEGKKYFRAYMLKEGATQTSELQILRNYANAIKNTGGTILFEGMCSGVDCAEVRRNHQSDCGDAESKS